jgi:hypothetical protein
MSPHSNDLAVLRWQPNAKVGSTTERSGRLAFRTNAVTSWVSPQLNEKPTRPLRNRLALPAQWGALAPPAARGASAELSATAEPSSNATEMARTVARNTSGYATVAGSVSAVGLDALDGQKPNR